MAEVHVKWSVILMDLLGPDIFSTLWMKEQVLHCERANLKVPDWSLVWNELLTKKLPMFLSHLNGISGGCEKIVPVSHVSESFWSNLKFLRMIDLSVWLWGWNVRVNGMGGCLFAPPMWIGSITSRCSGILARAPAPEPTSLGKERRPDTREQRKSSLQCVRMRLNAMEPYLWQVDLKSCLQMLGHWFLL